MMLRLGSLLRFEICVAHVLRTSVVRSRVVISVEGFSLWQSTLSSCSSQHEEDIETRLGKVSLVDLLIFEFTLRDLGLPFARFQLQENDRWEDAT